MSNHAKLTKKQKMWIIVATILFVVLVFSFAMFYVWATIEVSSKTVTFEQLKSKIGKYVVIPECLSEYTTECKIYFSKAERGDNHLFAKYTNFTVRNKYFEEYSISYKMDLVSGRVRATRERFEDYINPYLEEKDVDYYQKIVVDEVTYYYQVYRENYAVDVVFNKGDFHYLISAGSSTVDKEEIINTVKLIWGDLI